MKITDILKNEKLSISFEVFPPKSDASFESVMKATEEIASLSPSFMSVTYGAGGGTSKYTVDIAHNIQRNYHTVALAHLTCVSSSRETVAQQIENLKAASITNIMALRGDIPTDMQDYPRDFKYACELIEQLRASDADFCIGAACYPEVHPESENRASDLVALRHKVDVGADFLTTQMFFDNDLFYQFRDMATSVGIGCPIIPGIMPITSAAQIDRAIHLSGSYMPRRFLSLVEKFGSNPVAMKQAGIIYATDQIIDLFANGVKNVHVYSMNKPEVARAILNNLSGILG